MKNFATLLALALALVIGLSSCGDDEQQQLETDLALIEAYILEEGINASSTDSGLHYEIIEEGTGENPVASSIVSCHYVGTLLDGTEFDSSDQSASALTFGLTQVIAGWTEGIPLIKEGGSIILIIPSYLAYGENSPGAGIPANAVLRFDVELVDVQ
ncbi:FKBP-type peptidyl-prolyl cis-trans isomerase [Chitinophagales bacterium]|nr:FKBP-type peptidyl-prolyl cis-trans isomerase [Chitinophagales bacterium]